MRQVGLAALNYESSYQEFPFGIREDERPAGAGPYDQEGATGTSLNGQWAWSSFLLPYMEQDAIFQRLDLRGRISASTRLTEAVGGRVPLPAGGVQATRGDELANALRAKIEGFLCPSDSVDDINEHRGTGLFDMTATAGPVFDDNDDVVNIMLNGQASPLDIGLTSYVAANNVFVCHAQTLFASAALDSATPRGAYCSFDATSLGRVADGTSNTIVFGERIYDSPSPAQDRRPNGAGLLFMSRGLGGPEQFEHGIVDVAFSAWGGINLIVDRDADEDIALTVYNRRRQGLSSRHSGGLNVVRADGSVSFLRDSIDSYYNNVTDPVNGDVIDASENFVILPQDYGAYEKAIAVADGQPACDL
jgi:prepilin-type processing-associated H-X9-DG protein